MEDQMDISAVLFPHISLPKQALNRALTLFRPLKIFRPWFLEESIALKPYADGGAVRMDYPPEGTRPKGDFLKILKAYRDWNLEHRDKKGYAAYLQAQLGEDHSEDTTWGIREALRRFGQGVPPSGDSRFLKWHLILHLAHEMETSHREADIILRDLKDEKSPLKGALEGEEVESVFADLTHFQADPVVSEYHWAQIFDAWMGLFGAELKKNEVLVTFDRHVLEYVSEAIDPSSLAGDAHPEPPTVFNMPGHPLETLEEIDGYREKIIDPDAHRALAQLMGGTEKTAAEREILAGKIQASFSRHRTQGEIKVTVKPLGSPTRGVSEQGCGALSPLRGKNIVLVSDDELF